MQEVSFDPRYLDWVLSGKKTRTTRYAEAVAVGPARFRFESTPPVWLDATVTGVRTVGLADLGDLDAAAENFADAGELRAALRYHYPGLTNDAVVTVVSFRVGRQAGRTGEDEMEKRRLGRIGHETSVLVYGAAALGSVTQDVADASLTQAMAAGINHLDTAASYGDAEERMGPTVGRVRDQVFLATKSAERRAEDAWRELNRSLELLHTDHIDLWQIHAVCDLAELDKVFAPGGAIEAFVRAKDEGIVSWVGITGHTEAAPVVHAEALRRHDFDSILTPMNYHLYTADDEFRANFDILYGLVQDRDVALRTIKAIARKPWIGDRELATWYAPFTSAEDIRAAMSWVLGTFPYIAGLATAGETTLLDKAIAAESNRMDLAEAAAHLALVDDYSTIFV